MANKKIPTYNVNSKGLKGNNQTHQIVESDEGWDVEGKATFGSDVEVDGKLQVNTASDIVTKDGTSLGEEYYALSHTFAHNDSNNDEYQLTDEEWNAIYNDGSPKNLLINNQIKFKSAGIYSSSSITILLYDNVGYNFINLTDATYKFIIYHDYNNSQEQLTLSSMPKQITIDPSYDTLELSDTFVNDSDQRAKIGTINGQLIMTTMGSSENVDFKLATKQECWARYRHTVDITGKNSKGTNYISLRFTALSSKNTPIDSIQDLITLFANTKLETCGSLNGNDDDSILTLIKGINVGTSITDTTLQYCDLTTETLTTYSTDFTITDNVTQD